jgi:ribA/ribD-fused uncharacterized protein
MAMRQHCPMSMLDAGGVMTIYFYSIREEPYGVFSNFSAHGFTIDGKYWPTSEHYFQAQKFRDTPHEDVIRLERTPREAADRGRERSRPLRGDRENVKDDVMRRAVLAKFTAHPPSKALLLSTGDEPIVENAPGDYYWGCGANGTGANMLGIILMETRAILRADVGGRE